MVVALLLVVPARASIALGWELVATGAFTGAVALVIDHRAGKSEYEPGWWPVLAGARNGYRHTRRSGQYLGAAGRDHALTGASRPRDQPSPSFSAAIRVPATRLVIFWNATSRA
jgi:hypothetical protein